MDGSQGAAAAALWAADEVKPRKTTLLVVTAYGHDDVAVGGRIYPPSEWTAVKEAAAQVVLRDTVEVVRAAFPDLVVDAKAYDRSGAPVLIEKSSQARMLVVGKPAGTFAGL